MDREAQGGCGRRFADGSCLGKGKVGEEVEIVEFFFVIERGLFPSIYFGTG